MDAIRYVARIARTEEVVARTLNFGTWSEDLWMVYRNHEPQLKLSRASVRANAEP